MDIHQIMLISQLQAVEPVWIEAELCKISEVVATPKKMKWLLSDSHLSPQLTSQPVGARALKDGEKCRSMFSIQCKQKTLNENISFGSKSLLFHHPLQIVALCVRKHTWEKHIDQFYWKHHLSQTQLSIVNHYWSETWSGLGKVFLIIIGTGSTIMDSMNPPQQPRKSSSLSQPSSSSSYHQ